MLLGLETVHVHRKLGRGGQVSQIDELPAGQLRPVGDVEVLRQGVRLPAADFLEAAAPPYSRRSVEVEEAAGAVAGGVLDDEMAVEEDGLNPGQERVVAI